MKGERESCIYKKFDRGKRLEIFKFEFQIEKNIKKIENRKIWSNWVIWYPKYTSKGPYFVLRFVNNFGPLDKNNNKLVYGPAF